MNPQKVIATMRAILREQVTMSYMDRDAVRYIFDNRLIEHVQWPAWLMRLTDKGIAYIQDNTEYEETTT